MAVTSGPRTGARDGPPVVAGRYALLARLGSGGMGTVWRARDSVLHREVALKEVVFPPGTSAEDREVLRERTRREARVAALLHHPSAITVFDVVEDAGGTFIVMELVQAQTLAQVVRQSGPMSPQRAAEIGLPVLDALAAAHRLGIVHRDVKPSNVLVCDRDDPASTGRVVLTDFGIATSSGDSSLTRTGVILGSPSYISPERAKGERPGPASDLWSLGATLYTAVEGRPPFADDGPLATVVAVVTGSPAPFRSAGPLAPLLSALLAQDPARRPDAQQVRRALERVAAGPAEGSTTVTQPTVTPPSEAPEPADLRSSRTTVLSLEQVRQELVAAGGVPSPEPAAPPEPAEAPERPPSSSERTTVLPAWPDGPPRLPRPSRPAPPPRRRDRPRAGSRPARPTAAGAPRRTGVRGALLRLLVLTASVLLGTLLALVAVLVLIEVL